MTEADLAGTVDEPAVLAGTEHLGPAVARFDARVDELLERVRGNPVADQVFQAASHLGDFSLIWQLLGATRGLTSDRRADEAFRFAALLGLESLVVNQGVKRLFRRTRPTPTGDPRFPVRRPSTSSFPSGHASTAFFAAAWLSRRDPRLAPLWYAIAVVVGTSRAYVRIHHGSDVVAGAVLGTTLAAVAERAWPR